MEGTGGNLDQSSRVQCVVDWFGPTDLATTGGRYQEAQASHSHAPIKELAIKGLSPRISAAYLVKTYGIEYRYNATRVGWFLPGLGNLRFDG